jgi:hypothetical protein
MKKLLVYLFLALVANGTVAAQSSDPYNMGPVWQVQFVRMKPGMNDLYLKNLSDGWIKEMRAAKDQGLIMDFKVLQAQNASEDDWNLMLMYELKNYAMLDGMTDKMKALAAKMFGTEEVQHTNAVSRNDLRVLQGGRLTQELDFK